MFDWFGVMLLEDDNFGLLYGNPESMARELRMNFIFCGERSSWVVGG